MSDTTTIPPAPTHPPTDASWSDTQKILALTVVGALIIIILLLILLHPTIDTVVMGVVTTLVGGLLNQAGTVVSYYFGSNKQSQAKDQTIAAMAGTGAGGSSETPKT